jgi:hypothetical protein
VIVRAQSAVLALIANVPVEVAAETWMDDGFNVSVHWPKADPQAASASAKRYRCLNVIEPRITNSYYIMDRIV